MESCIPSRRRSVARSEGMAGGAILSSRLRRHVARGGRGLSRWVVGVAVLAWLLPICLHVATAQSLSEAQRLRASGLQPLPTGTGIPFDARLEALLAKKADADEGLDEPNDPNEVLPLEEMEPSGDEEPSTIELLLSGRVPPDACDV